MVVVGQTIIPDYRQPVFEILRERLGAQLLFASGHAYFDPTLTTRAEVDFAPLRNHYFAGRRLAWQSGMLSKAMPARVVVLELNPRIVSTWALLLARRVLRRPTLLWGHAWPRRGRAARTDKLRHLQRSLASGLVLYTESDRKMLHARMGRKPLFVAPNAIFRAADAFPHVTSTRSTFLFTGRLVPSKKPVLLLNAFGRVAQSLPADVRLVYVGDGPLRATLEEAVERMGLRSRVEFAGHVDPARTAAFFADAIASVSPGYVGLSLTQSIANGVPMIIARDEPHAPEVEAAVEGANAIFFESDSEASLATELEAMTHARQMWASRASDIAASARIMYSAEAMADGVIRALCWFAPDLEVRTD